MKNIFNLCILLCMVSACGDSSEGARVSPGTGVGGSLARFTISGNHLYTVGMDNMQVFSIENLNTPSKVNELSMEDGVETIFPYQGNLFIGAQNGMYIYSLADPTRPELLSLYQHITSCDPVVVQGQYAYVTLRTGTDCRMGENLLEVIDVSDLRNPVLLETIQMNNPWGLGVDGSLLFVCERGYGLVVFDISDPEKPVEKRLFANIDGYDVIPNQNVLILTGNDGIFQYNYSNTDSIYQISHIPVGG